MKDFREIISDIRNGKFAPVYLLSGDEPYYLDLIVENLEAAVVPEDGKAFDQTIFFGADSTVSMVIDAASRFPVLSQYQLVMLKESQAMQHVKTNLDKLKEYVANPIPSTVLVVVYKGDKLSGTSSLMKAAQKNKDVVVFNSMKIRDYNMGPVVKDYCREQGIAIEDKAVAMLIEYVGNSMEKITSEIAKLKVATGDKKRITASDIEENIGMSKEYNNFELLNALLQRNYPQVMRILKHFSDNPKANPAIVTASTLFNSFQRLLIAHFAKDKSERGLMDALQLKNAYALREIRGGMQNYSAEQCVNAIHAIREFDVKSKGVGSFQKEHPLLKDTVFRIITS